MALYDVVTALVLFIIGAFAAAINVNAGGGSSLTLPALIFLGLDSATANGTNRFAIILQTFSSVTAYKNEKYHQFKLSVKLSLLTLPGAIIGAIAAVQISDKLFETILGFVILGIVVILILPEKKLENRDDSSDRNITLPVFISFFITGFYGGFIQVGVGFILMAILNKLMKFSLVYVNMHKSFVVLFYTVPAFMVFLFTGNINWYYAIVLGLGNSAGAWWATKVSIKKGEKFIKLFLVVAFVLIALKLLNIIL